MHTGHAGARRVAQIIAGVGTQAGQRAQLQCLLLGRLEKNRTAGFSYFIGITFLV